jgi:transposase
MSRAVEALASDLHERGGVDLSECFVGGSFCMAKRGLLLARLERGKGTKIMAISDATGVILSVSVQSASPHEVTLVESTLAESFLEPAPVKLIGDKAYDSDKLDGALKEKGIEVIAPHRRNRKSERLEDGRKLRRYKRRWKVEGFFAWLFNYRSTVVRYEYMPEHYEASVLLACILILIKAFTR